MRFDPGAVPAALANRVLEREAWARGSLAAHAGRVFKLAVGPFATSLRIDVSGAFEAVAATDSATDLTLRVSPTSVPALLADPARWDDFVAADGDSALAATLKGLAETLPWFVERAFAGVLGPMVGQYVADTGRRLLAFPSYAGQRVGASVTGYLRDEAPFGVTAAEARSMRDEIAATASRVDALAARIDALAVRLGAGSPGA
jgi:ubiquinone biosynthesis protein UbiJ